MKAALRFSSKQETEGGLLWIAFDFITSRLGRRPCCLKAPWRDSRRIKRPSSPFQAPAFAPCAVRDERALFSPRRRLVQKRQGGDRRRRRRSPPALPSLAVLFILIVERYSPDSRYQSGTISCRFNPAPGVSPMPRNNVTSCESTRRSARGGRIAAAGIVAVTF